MKKYPSKIDLWVAALLACITVTIGWTAWQSSNAVGFTILAAWIGCLAVTAVPCYYVLEDDHLFIRAGVWKWRIPYADIQTVTPSQSVLAGPSLSFQRVEIISGEAGSVLVSPVNRDEFINELKQRLPAHKQTSESSKGKGKVKRPASGR